MTNPPTDYRIVAPHYVASLAVNEEGVVVDAAPILSWAIGKRWWSDVRQYIIRKGYDYAEISKRS